jgi:hypothetical protein
LSCVKTRHTPILPIPSERRLYRLLVYIYKRRPIIPSSCQPSYPAAEACFISFYTISPEGQGSLLSSSYEPSGSGRFRLNLFIRWTSLLHPGCHRPPVGKIPQGRVRPGAAPSFKKGGPLCPFRSRACQTARSFSCSYVHVSSAAHRFRQETRWRAKVLY